MVRVGLGFEGYLGHKAAEGIIMGGVREMNL